MATTQEMNWSEIACNLYGWSGGHYRTLGTISVPCCPDCKRFDGGHQPDCIWAEPEKIGKE